MIEKLFFPSGAPFLASLKTLIVFFIGYLFRPLAEILFSHFGDFCVWYSFIAKHFPDWNHCLGITGFILDHAGTCTLGGEIPGAITFVVEHVDNNR